MTPTEAGTVADVLLLRPNSTPHDVSKAIAMTKCGRKKHTTIETATPRPCGKEAVRYDGRTTIMADSTVIVVVVPAITATVEKAVAAEVGVRIR